MSTYQNVYTASHLLAIGINEYGDPRFVPLGNAEADAQQFARVLSAPPYDFYSSILLGSQATRQAILEALFQLRGAGPDDRILVYFAGHGYTLTNKRGYETGYLACADTLPEQDFTALELGEVTRLCDHTDAKHIAFIFDACFSGQALGMTRAISEGYLERRAYQVLSAGAGDQTVSDYRSMTQLLVEALQFPPNDVLSLNALGLHIQSVMRAGSRGRQVPQIGHLIGSQGGDFVFRWPEPAEYPAATPVPEPAPLARPDTVESRQVARPQAQPRRRTTRANPLWIAAGILGAILVLGIIGVIVVSGWIKGTPETASREETTAQSQEPTDVSTHLAAEPQVTRTEAPAQEPSQASVTPPTILATEAPSSLPTGFEPVTSNSEWTPVIQEFDGVELTLVPVGCFMMGSNDGEANEKPAHEVCFEEPFWIDVTEVTNAQYEALGGRSTVAYSWTDGQTPRQWVIWGDAVDFCTNRGARLPTEAEWEYAARGPESWIYAWGDVFDANKVVFGRVVYLAVGSHPEGASWVGALDMTGSVSEWVSDLYGPYGADSQINPTGAAESTYHLLKGGSAWESTYRLRASFRFPYSPSYEADQFGFRCARDY